MYLKKLFDQDTFIIFDSAIQAELAKGAPHSIKTLVDTLRSMILTHIPRRGRLTKMRERTTKINQMGDNGENLLSYTERLILEMDQSGWSIMMVAEATVLY